MVQVKIKSGKYGQAIVMPLPPFLARKPIGGVRGIVRHGGAAAELRREVGVHGCASRRAFPDAGHSRGIRWPAGSRLRSIPWRRISFCRRSAVGGGVNSRLEGSEKELGRWQDGMSYWLLPLLSSISKEEARPARGCNCRDSRQETSSIPFGITCEALAPSSESAARRR